MFRTILHLASGNWSYGSHSAEKQSAEDDGAIPDSWFIPKWRRCSRQPPPLSGNLEFWIIGKMAKCRQLRGRGENQEGSGVNDIQRKINEAID
jgi:hypothetical protein